MNTPLITLSQSYSLSTFLSVTNNKGDVENKQYGGAVASYLQWLKGI